MDDDEFLRDNPNDSESMELSGISNFGDTVDNQDYPLQSLQPAISSVRSKPQKPGELSTIAEESQVRSLSRSVSTNSSSSSTLVPRNNQSTARNSTASSFGVRHEMSPIPEQHHDSMVHSRASRGFSSNVSANHRQSQLVGRSTKFDTRNQTRESQTSSRNTTFDRSEIRNRLGALKPVERFDYAEIMNSLNLRSSVFNKENNTPIAELPQNPHARPGSSGLSPRVVLGERTINGKLRVPMDQTPSRAVQRDTSKSSQSTQRSTSKACLSVQTAASNSKVHDQVTLNSTTTNNQKVLIQVNPIVLAFGFVDLKKRTMMQLTIRNSSDRPVRFEPSVLCDEDQKGVFELDDSTSFTVQSQSSFLLPVYFTAKNRKSFDGILRLASMGFDFSVYRIGMFGFGGRTQLSFCQSVSQRTEPIEFGMDEIGVCWTDRNQTGLRLVLRNVGQRAAFAFLSLSDGTRGSIFDQTTISPNRLIVLPDKSQMVDLRFPHGMSALFNYSQSTSRMSNGSGRSVRTISNEQLVRLHVYWGEERQRQRVKSYFQQNGNQHKTFNGIDFTSIEFNEEYGDVAPKLAGKYDVQAFDQALRRTTIQFFDPHVPSHLNSRPVSAASWCNGTYANSIDTFQEHSRVQPVEEDETMQRCATVGSRRFY